MNATPSEVLRRFYEEFWNAGNAAAADDLVHPDVVDHQLYPGQSTGIEGFKQLVVEWRAGFPDMTEEIEAIHEDGQIAVGRFRLRGTHLGTFLGIEPSGRAVDIRGIDIVRVVDGKITDFWYNEQTLELLQQLGALPPTAEILSMGGTPGL